jgi:hypothetical protein
MSDAISSLPSHYVHDYLPYHHYSHGGESKLGPNGGQKLNLTAHDVFFDPDDRFLLINTVVNVYQSKLKYIYAIHFSCLSKYSTHSPFAGVTFLKTPVNGKTELHEVQTL